MKYTLTVLLIFFVRAHVKLLPFIYLLAVSVNVTIYLEFPIL